MYDLILKNASVFFPLGYCRPPMDMAIAGGKIAAVQSGLQAEARRTIDLAGRVVMPGFVDAHLHADTAYTVADGAAYGQLEGYAAARAALARRYEGKTPAAIAADMYERSAALLRKCLAHGTTAARLQLDFAPGRAQSAMDAYEALKKDFAGRMTLRCTVPYEEETAELWKRFAEAGRIGFIGGYPCLTSDRSAYAADPQQNAEALLQLSRAYNLPLDLHMDEPSTDPAACPRYIASRALAKKNFSLYTRVTLSHVSAVSAPEVAENEALDVVNRCAKGNVHIVELTSQGMVAFGTPFRRGTTRLRAFLDAGANVSLASGDVQNSLHPFGNGDLLAETLTAAQAHKFGAHRELRRLLELITFNPAKAMKLADYGALPGCRADLVVLDATTPEDALLSQAERLYVLKDGRPVVENGVLLTGEGC